MNSTLKSNLKSESFWIRSIFMVLFFIVYRIVDILVLLVAICQWLYMLLTGDANASLSRFAGGLASYVAQIIQYLSYQTEEKPYPFSDWPQAAAPEQSKDAAVTEKLESQD